jgi:hypothetical protein
MANSVEDPHSMKVWVKVIMQAPIQELLMNPQITLGFDLVKLVLEKVW